MAQRTTGSFGSELKLGVIGLSEGNGHPYSWSAIFNGYDPGSMSVCPFPVIPDYLARQSFPDDQILGAKVTHIWTQSEELSHSISQASKIPHVCTSLTTLADSVDAVLLARDDAENHWQFAHLFLQKGLPIFIDKPLALSISEAQKILDAQLLPNQVFTCSSLRCATTLQRNRASLEAEVGPIMRIEAESPKSWEKYAVHLIEPVVSMLWPLPPLVSAQASRQENEIKASFCWADGVEGTFHTTGSPKGKFRIRIIGERGTFQVDEIDTFQAFKASLEWFIGVVTGRRENIPRDQTLQIVSMIRDGLK